MKILDKINLKIPEVVVIKFAKFPDERGYFGESFRLEQIREADKVLKDFRIVQINEAYSKAGVFRGLHFQWNPFQAKMVRCITGRLIDFALDVRPGSPTLGKAVCADLRPNEKLGDRIFIPTGFAHGVLFPEDSIIEYLCDGAWSPGCEASISIFDEAIDFSLCDSKCKSILDEILASNVIIKDKDRNGLNLENWLKMDESKLFEYERLKAQ